MRSYTNDTLQPAASTSALADWLRLDDTSDPLLAPMLYAATQSVIDYLQRDLIARDWVLVHESWPLRDRQLTKTDELHNYFKTIELPYAGALSVDTVTVYGSVIDAAEYRVADTLPSAIKFIDAVYPVIADDDHPAITVTYRAGFGETADSVPESIKSAVLMIAAFMYSHRGACDASSAISMSGSAILLQPWRVRGGLTL